MNRIDRIRSSIEQLEAREFAAAGAAFSDDVKFHAPGLGVDVQGRDAMLDQVRRFIEQADVHYDLEDIVERGPFVVAFQRSTGTVGGRRMWWSLCQICRFDGDEATEVWALRGSDPQPVDG